MVADALDISRETYFAIVLDRDYDGPVMVGSPVGGMDIEEVAEKQPDKIFKVKFKFEYIYIKGMGGFNRVF